MRKCIIVANTANLAGFLNNLSSDAPLRLDYKNLLTTAANGREVIGAFAVSQYDLQVMSSKSQEQRARNKKFLFSLKALGWTPLQVSYNSSTKEMSTVVNQVWKHIYELLVDENEQYRYDLAEIDIVFITGSGLWYDLISPFHNNGFIVEIFYPKNSTASVLHTNFHFRDMFPHIKSGSLLATPGVHVKNV